MKATKKSRNKRLETVGLWAARLILAATFLFSGIVKAIDPKGTAIKFSEYLSYFHLDALANGSLMIAASIALCTVEFVLGIYLLFGLRRKITAYLTLIVTSVFALLTLFILIANPVRNCGCFGDALVLTNWQTFIKNILLLGCAIALFYGSKRLTRLIPYSLQWLVSLYSILFIISFAIYNNHYLPIMDFRPYKIGTNIQMSMEIPDNAETTKYETTFLLKKNGEEKEFTLKNYPDSTWTFVKSINKIVAKGYTPPISDFSISDSLGQDLTQQILNDTAYTFLLISPNFENANMVQLDEINAIYDYCMDRHHKFYALTASTKEGIKRWIYYTGAEYPILMTDGTVLKTMVRANPGLLLLKKGTILNKWSYNNLPRVDGLKSVALLSVGVANSARQLLIIFLFYLIPLLFITFAFKLWKQIHNNKITNRNMRKKIVAGNWKMNMNLQDGIALAKEINAAMEADKPNCGVVICTPFIHLASVAPLLDKNLVQLGAEDCANKEKGAFTGEVSAEMVKSTGADYVILGHSERRQYYNETAEVLKDKVQLALKNNLKIIFCCGETLEEREANKQDEVVKAELLGSVFNLSAEEWKNIVLAYEPIWAIGTGKTATSEQAQDMLAYIRSIVAEKYGKEAADDTTILYGGSCKPSNAKELFAKPDIDGGLIGGASLKVADFKGIIDAWK